MAQENMVLANGKKQKNRTADYSHSLYTAIKRVCHAAVVAGILAMAVMLIVLLQQYQNDWLKVQTQFSGESAARQYAKLLEGPLANYVVAKNTGVLSNIAIANGDIENVLNVLNDEPHILGLSVFNSDGQYIAPLPKIPSIIKLSKSNASSPLTFVKDIHNENGDLLGYVNIHINTDVVLKSPLTLRTQLLVILLILLGFAFILGVYITRTFYKSRPWFIAQLGQK